MVTIAKRENNNKRKYLVVNKLQGKHIPVSGQTAFDVFDSLAQKVEENCKGEKLLLVGFAETATAIGARLAVKLRTDYMQTTREQVSNAEYLFFTESHSHATEQKLVKNDIDSVINSIDRIVFVEDEVTTGNTIMKIIDIIEKLYPDKVQFSVASLLNGMNEESLSKYKKRNIDIYYIQKTNHSEYTAIAESFSGNGKYFPKNTHTSNVEIVSVADGYLNARRLVNGNNYNASCEKLFDIIKSQVNLENIKNMLVIGTEEFMYPALFTAQRFEKEGFNVYSHSTTRSPIVTSNEDDYPLHERFELASFYDKDRKTFIYNLKKYDCVIVITDANPIENDGVNSLVNALRSVGNDKIYVYRWCDDE